MKAATDIGIAHHVQIQKPKRITPQHIQRLSKVTPKVLRQVAEDINKPTPQKVGEELTTGHHKVGTFEQRTFNPLARRLAAAKAAQVRVANEAAMSPEQREALRKQRAERFNAQMKNVDRSKAANKAAKTRKEQGTDVFSNLTAEQRAKASKTREEKYYARQADIMLENFKDLINKVTSGSTIVHNWLVEAQNVRNQYASPYAAEWHGWRADLVINLLNDVLSNDKEYNDDDYGKTRIIFERMMENVVENESPIYDMIKYILYDSEIKIEQVEINLEEIWRLIIGNMDVIHGFGDFMRYTT